MSVIIESIIKRKAGTTLDFPTASYHFKPNNEGAHVAEVEDEAHIARLLSIPEGYRLYQGTAAKPAPTDPTEPVAPPAAPEGTNAAQPAVVTAPDAPATSLEAAQAALEEARALYIQAFGKKPHHTWGVEKIKAEIAAKPASTEG